MTSPSIVRQARPEDKSEIWRLFRSLHLENGVSRLAPEKVDYHIDRLLEPQNIVANDNGPRGLIGVIGPIGALEACIMLSFGSQWYSHDITLDEYLNYVLPEHRASSHSTALIRYAKRMVDELIPVYPEMKLIIGVLSTNRTAAKVRLYEKQLRACGAFFIYPPPLGVATHNAPLRKLYRTH